MNKMKVNLISKINCTRRTLLHHANENEKGKKSKKHKTKPKLVANFFLKTLHADRRMVWKEKTTRYDS